MKKLTQQNKHSPLNARNRVRILDMEAGELQEILRVFESSLSQIKWRLKPSSKRHLETDILALITEMRPVIMVDYGGKMPELQERLCSFLKHCQKMIPQSDENSAFTQLLSIQKKFSTFFQLDGLLQCEGTDKLDDTGPSAGQPSASASSEFIDLSSWLEETQVTVPTLNGWLLGYPVVYLFSVEHIQEAIYNLSTKSLHLYQVLVSRNGTSGRGSKREELMSFSVPYDLSLEGGSEPWAKAFLASMRGKLERCKQVWGSLQMEVSGCYPQAVVL